MIFQETVKTSERIKYIDRDENCRFDFFFIPLNLMNARLQAKHRGHSGDILTAAYVERRFSK